MHKMQIFLLAFLATAVVATAQRGDRRYTTSQVAASSRFSNRFSDRHNDDDSDEDFQLGSSRFSSGGNRFSNVRFSIDSDEFDQDSDEGVHFNRGSFNNGFRTANQQGSFFNKGSRFSNQGSRFSDEDSGFSQQSGFSNAGSRFSDEDDRFPILNSGFSNQNSGISNQNSRFSDQNSGFSDHSRFSSNQNSGLSSQGFPGFSNQGSRFSNKNSDFSSSRGSSGPLITILRDDRDGPVGGYYSFQYETSDGVVRSEEGSPDGPGGSVVQRGSWSFVYPDGTPAEFTFVADENGFQVDSDLLPTPPPLPAHAVAQIEKAERERAAGIFHDGSYREEDHLGSGGSFDSFRGSSARTNFGGSSFGGTPFSGGSSSTFDDNSGSFGGNSGSFQGSSGFVSGNSRFSANSRQSSIGGNSGSFRANSGRLSSGVPLPSFTGASSNRRASNQRQSNPRYVRSGSYYDFEDVEFESQKL